MEDSDLTIIRPLIYVSEAEVKGFRNKYQLPVVKNPCPMDGNTKREYVKKLMKYRRLCHHLHLSAQSGSDRVRKAYEPAVRQKAVSGYHKSAERGRSSLTE